MRIARYGCIAVLALLALACKKPNKDKDAPAGSGSAATAGGVKGLAAAGNDAGIVAAAKTALACTWKSDSLSFDSDCAGWKAWTQSSDVYNTATSDTTFVNMLEDSDVKVRLLACYHLGYDSERKFTTNADLAKRIVAAAGAETQSHSYIDALAKAIAKIQHAKTGTWAQTKAVLDSTSIKSLDRWALDFLLDYNETDQQIWDYVKSRTKDPDKSIAEWAVYGFGSLSTRKDDACKVFVELLPDDRVGGDACSAIGLQSNDCASYVDTALQAADARTKAGNIADSDWATGLERIAQNVKTSDAQKKKAVAILDEIAANAHIDGWMRANAIRDVYEVDKMKGKLLAAKYLRDKDSTVASAAKDVAAKPAK
jgi:hypothetical protein